MRALQIHKNGIHLATVSDDKLDELTVTISATPDSTEPCLLIQGQRGEAGIFHEYQWANVAIELGAEVTIKHTKVDITSAPALQSHIRPQQHCSFCGKTQDEVGELKHGKYAFAKICAGCLAGLASKP